VSDKQPRYRQCVLTRELPGGNGSQSFVTSWIEERFAVVGKRVFIKDDPAFSEDTIYTVKEVGNRQTEKWVKDRRKAHERWRQVTDV